VVITSIGTSTGKMRPENAAALVGAGMISVLLFPLLGFSRLSADRRSAGAAPAGELDPASDLDQPESL
jgi:hypothetical protein